MRLIDTEKLNLLAEKAKLEQEVAPMLTRISEIKALLKSEAKINWNEKALQCLQYVEEPLTTDEILKWIFYRREHEIQDHKVRREYFTRLSVSLLRLCDRGYIQSESLEGCKAKVYVHTDYAQKPDFVYKLEKKKKDIINAKTEFYRQKIYA
jgi:hypothetical protein